MNSFVNGGREVFLEAIHEDDEHPNGKDIMDEKVDFKKPAIFKHKENLNLIQAEQDMEDAREEWEQVGLAHPGTLVVETICSFITCEEVLSYFKSKNMAQYLKNIKPVRQRNGIDALKHWFVGPPKLQHALVTDRNLFFAIALCPFDTSDFIHVRVLQTVYRTITGAEQDCPRYGRHWEEIGFQGIDPGTDLRGVGFLGLIHLLFLVLNPATSELSRDIASLSKTERQNFPFCVMGINLTRIVIEAMRDEVLNKECNRRMSLFQVTNEYYAGIYLHLYKTWKEKNKNILDSGYVIKDLNTFAKKYPLVIFKELIEYIKKKQTPSKINAIIQFSDIGDTAAQVNV